jgi:hypothetical protein
MDVDERWMRVAEFHDEYSARTRATEFLVETLFGQLFAHAPAAQHEEIIAALVAQARVDFRVGAPPGAKGPERMIGHVERLLRLGQQRDPFASPAGTA